jgi:hypothetical protein
VRSLSSLLQEAAQLDADLPALVALLAVYAYNPDAGAAQRRGDEHARLAVRADTVLDSAGFHGDDLWLTTAQVLPDTVGGTNQTRDGEPGK